MASDFKRETLTQVKMGRSDGEQASGFRDGLHPEQEFALCLRTFGRPGPCILVVPLNKARLIQEYGCTDGARIVDVARDLEAD